MEDSVHIILADDDADDRLVFCEALRKASPETELSTANDGLDLMEVLGSVPGGIPRLIFLDLNMPVKTGHECLKEIRSNPVFTDIPVVIYSTSVNSDDIEKALNAGADFYLPKPASFNELVVVIRHLIDLKRDKHEAPAAESFVLEADRLVR